MGTISFDQVVSKGCGLDIHKKRALIAVGHSILKSVYHILSEGVAYNELGADYINSRLEAKRKAYLTKELEKLGCEVILNPLGAV